MAGKMDKATAQRVAAMATKILSDLGLKTEVRLFDPAKVGKEFTTKDLGKTDSWAVIGTERKAVAKKARELNREQNGNAQYDKDVNAWEGQRNYQEVSSGYRDSPPNSDKGIAVDYNDSN